jgi:AAA family ATP:ADP antiporter
LERLLNLRPGEFVRGFLLFFYLFLIISSYVLGKAARDVLFIYKYTPVQLAYADMTVTALAGFVIALYLWISRHVRLHVLIAVSLVFFASNVGVFWWLGTYHKDLSWLNAAIYVWMGIYGVLAPAQCWTLAGTMLTTREAKRLFGLVGSGAILGWIVGGYFTTVVAKAFPPNAMLAFMAATLLVCTGLVVIIWRQNQSSRGLTNEQLEASAGAAPSGGLRQSFALIQSSPYLRAIAVIILMSSFTTALTGWQFKVMTKQFLHTQKEATVFLGAFNFYAGLASLAAQLLFTTRFLKRFGLGLALFIVPVALMMSSVGVLLLGTLLTAVLLKGSDQVLRYSIDKTTVELLYLPVPSAHKSQVKSFIDTVVWRLGDGLSGILIVIFVATLKFSPSQMSAVVIVLLLGWAFAAYKTRGLYVSYLGEGIHKHRLDAERAAAPVLDKFTADILAGKLSAGDPKDVLYALSLFDIGHEQATHPAVKGLLKHASPEVRQKAVSILAAAGDKSVIQDVERLLHDEHLGVRTEALLYLAHLAHVDPLDRIEQLGDFEDFSLRSAMVAFLARPGKSQNLDAANLMLGAMVSETGPDSRRVRLEAARLVESLPAGFDDHLKQLLADLDPEVAKYAIRAVAKAKKRALVDPLLARIHEPALTQAITDALAAFGEKIVGTLGDLLADETVPIEVRREIPGVLMQIGTAAAGTVMAEHLLEPDTRLRFKIITALNKISQNSPGLKIDAEVVEILLMAEITGHYRSYQIVGILGGRLESSDPVVQGLRFSMTQEVERIFRLLKLQFPRFDLHSAFVGIQSTDAVVHDNSLEFLESILKPELRNLMLPLIDSEVDIPERVRKATQLVGAGLETHEEAVAALVVSEDPWLRSCAAYAIGSLGLKALGNELDKWLEADDPLLRETARQAKEQLANLA